MASFHDFSEAAHDRLLDTITWGEELLKQSDQVTVSAVPAELICETQNWIESMAFWVNFVMDGQADHQLLSVYPSWQKSAREVPRENADLQPWISIRVDLLRQSLDALLLRLAEPDARRADDEVSH